ncbi:MAG: hypothetical protein HY319_22985 [Armatimonadetes bacterium]|nr:hypothetical protein [Armatimonadota bacterium]
MTAYTSADHFHFSEDYVEEAFEEQLDFEGAPVDPENPGFASLLTALYLARDGDLGAEVLRAYHSALTQRLQEARRQLADIRVPEEIWQQVAPAVAATQAMLDELADSLDLLADHVATGRGEALEEAIVRLEGVHDELRAAF